MHEVIVSHEKPIIYDALVQRFGIDWEKGIIIAYDGKVYCKNELDPQKTIHEAVHLHYQQLIGNEVWWRLYMENDQFRLDEEIKAMRAELVFLKKYIKNREHLFYMKREIVHSLASNIYGNIVTKERAWQLLK